VAHANVPDPAQTEQAKTIGGLAMSMINGKTITQTVTLGAVNSYPTFASPLTITSTGAIYAGRGNGIDGGVTGHGSIDNAGKIGGGYGSYNGAAGILLSVGGSITNSGAITGGGDGYAGAAGIVLLAGGGIANSGAITGSPGGDVVGNGGPGGGGIVLSGSGSVVNLGEIQGGAGGYYFGAGGTGIVLATGGSIANIGIIAGGLGGSYADSAPDGAGLVLSAGGVVTNGSAGDTTALITGGIGIQALGTRVTTVTNFATIASTNRTGGTAVSFSNAKSVLVIEGGSRLVGKVVGGGGTLDLAGGGGPGTLSGLGSEVTGFAQVSVLAGADWTLGGNNTIGSGTTLTAAGRLAPGSGGLIAVVSGGVAIVPADGVATGITVTAAGSETVFGRTSGGTVSSGGRQIVRAGAVAIGASVKLGGDQTVSSGGTARATVVSGGAEYVRGTASGTIVYGGGTQNVHGTTRGTALNGGTEYVSSGGTASGTTVNSGGREVVSSGGAAKGTIVDSGGKEIVYAGDTTNATTISGGLVEVMSGAYVSGRLFTFSGGGTLQLDRSVYFKGQIAGFGPPDQLDLRDIAFVSGTTTVSFAEAASHTSGTLTVASGAHTSKLTLLGSYVTSQFTLTSDGHGGTLVTDPPVAGGGTAQTTFADIAPARSLSGAVSPGNRATFLPGAIATNEQSHAGQILLATGPPEGRMAPTTIPCS